MGSRVTEHLIARTNVIACFLNVFLNMYDNLILQTKQIISINVVTTIIFNRNYLHEKTLLTISIAVISNLPKQLRRNWGHF